MVVKMGEGGLMVVKMGEGWDNGGQVFTVIELQHQSPSCNHCSSLKLASLI